MSKIKTITKTFFLTFAVYFNYGEEGERKEFEARFSNVDDAAILASLKRGSWGSTGEIKIEESLTIPEGKIFDTFEEWGEDNLSVKEYKLLKSKKLI